MHRIPILTVAALMATAAGAQTLVWDNFSIPNNSSSNINTSGTTQSTGLFGVGDPGTNDLREVDAFDTVNALWTATGSNPPITVPMFGGYAAVAGDIAVEGGSSTNLGFILRRAFSGTPPTTTPEGTPNQIRPQVTVPGRTGASWAGVAFAPLGAPLNTADLGAIYVRTGGGNPAVGAYRAVVRSGSSFYVSDASLAIAGGFWDQAPGADNSAFELFAGVGGATWQLWDFTANSGDNYAVTLGSLGTLPATIDGIGFYLNGTTDLLVNLQNNVLGLGYTAVPEPAALASLLALGTLGLAAVRRRR